MRRACAAGHLGRFGRGSVGLLTAASMVAISTALALGCGGEPERTAGGEEAARRGRSELAAIERRIAISWKRGSESELHDLLDEAVVLLPPAAESVVGRRQVSRWMAAHPGAIAWNARARGDVEIRVGEGLGYVVWGDELTPERRRGATRGLAVYRSSDEGAWRLLRLVWNTGVVPRRGGRAGEGR